MHLQEQHGYQKQQVTPATAGTPATAENTGDSGDGRATHRY